MNVNDKNLWEILWQYDPNALVVVDTEFKIAVVNPAFCKMFAVETPEAIGREAIEILGDIQDFKTVWKTQDVIRGKEREYSDRGLYVKQVIFPIQDRELIACIMVDITEELQRKKEMIRFKTETVAKVNEVVDNQMKVAQEIAGLLGETTAETKVSLLKIIKMIEQENV
ncbi:PAS domain-containing protein [Oxynema sp. CENA135]|uniref:PAS domain-containing protein n=1 Tax=Oxynema sp. CENA135 TaxID=984206 RepID=UPI00190DA4A1|nr:PAS domain S-box protein [Oxynema sp. CENA135]MBK4729748.1 PAS domain-containing protein [Oxynema sp. CENA135]